MATIAELEATVAEKEAAYYAAAEKLAPLRTVQAEQDYVQNHYRAALSLARAQGVLLNGPATFQQARESYRELVEMAREVYDEALKDLTRARVALWHADAAAA
jgi:hypothetical protein